MSEHSYFSDFDDNDVVSFSELNLYKSRRLKYVMSEMCRSHIDSVITDYLNKSEIHGLPRYPGWMGDGVRCEALKLGSQKWQKGKIKIRVSVEFYPDEPEVIEEPPSPLDDIRQSMI
ncbi:KGK domain-containing protein [Pannus brasiliensis CCIBt3594]|uniref:KGK domain-containing protein n=1 Tax=Pannus brasiliensis CCIBt3594 TaxID=1427578 RepID=A0AAW9QQ98_9CHRO